MIEVEKLKLVLPENLVFEMQGTLERFSINTSLRVSHFLAQCKHESAAFTRVEEGLNYSSVGLLYTFAKYFPDKPTADAYARQPQKIANRVYANRMGNGDELSGDGWKFKGRGYIQTTGRANYQSFSAAMRDDMIMTTPDLLLIPKYACLSAGYFWSIKKLNDIADRGADDDVVKQVTFKVNGGYNGLGDRQKAFKTIYEKLK